MSGWLTSSMGPQRCREGRGCSRARTHPGRCAARRTGRPARGYRSRPRRRPPGAGLFRRIETSRPNPAVRICVKKKALDPASLVEYAAALRDREPGAFDEVWCVVDVDQFDMVAAVRASHDCDVRLAVSNPCFEVWLLLHFRDCRAAVNGAADAVRRLKRHVPQYSKSTLRVRTSARVWLRPSPGRGASARWGGSTTRTHRRACG